MYVGSQETNVLNARECRSITIICETRESVLLSHGARVREAPEQTRNFGTKSAMRCRYLRNNNLIVG